MATTTYEGLKAEIDAKGEAYRASDSLKDREALSTEIDGLQKELQEMLSKGANPCPDEPARADDANLSVEQNESNFLASRHRVIGMLKRPAYYDGRLEMDVPEQYEVGCIRCPPVLVERENGTDLNGTKVVRWSHSARGASPKEAVTNWNAGKWVEDRQIDRVPTQAIFKP